MRILILCLMLSVFFFSCKESGQKIRDEVPALEWIEGKWEQITDSVQLYEVWEKSNDSLYEGRGIILDNGDTIFCESIIVKREGGDIFYIPTVPTPLGKEITRFRLVSKIDGKHYIFENSEHDWPQRIIYEIPAFDSVTAVVEGMVDSKMIRETIRYSREKP
ncbi:MAG: hypothetical protein KKD47_01320 [Proteobacteria bacterium]|nr:hypothetical protein [Pseudomonadota bacterium]